MKPIIYLLATLPVISAVLLMFVGKWEEASASILIGIWLLLSNKFIGNI